MKKFGILSASFVMCLMGFTQVSIADDWVVTKLRGNVFAYDGADWQRLDKGGVVSDNRAIRTTRGGRAEFTRDKETISIGGDTQIRISDRNGERYTVVNQDFGKVEIEAEKRQVKHFAVQTPYLAAVVKGTRFLVTVSGQSASVEVRRGVVSAVDSLHGLKVDVVPGQTAEAGVSQVLGVSGKGEFAAVTDLKGNVVSQNVLGALVSNGVGSGNGNGNASGIAKGVAPGLPVARDAGAGLGLGTDGGVGVGASVGGGASVRAEVGGGAGVGVGVGVGNDNGDAGGGGLGVSANVGGLGVKL